MAAYQFLGNDIVAPFSINSNEPVFNADSVALKVRRVKQGAQRWELEFNVTMQDASGFLPDMVSNFYTTITMEMPQLNVKGDTISQGTSTSAITATGSVGATSVALTGANGTINKGRFIKFSNHDKMYLVTAQYGGSGSISIYPGLTSAVSATPLLYRDGTDSITFTGYIDINNISGITFTDGVLSESGTINLIEAL